jgi:hypothetical protein
VPLRNASAFLLLMLQATKLQRKGRRGALLRVRRFVD